MNRETTFQGVKRDACTIRTENSFDIIYLAESVCCLSLRYNKFLAYLCRGRNARRQGLGTLVRVPSVVLRYGVDNNGVDVFLRDACPFHLRR